MEPPEVVLTGATSGIGREAALLLAAEGIPLVLVVRDVARGAGVADAARAAGAPSVSVLEADLSLVASVRRLAAALNSRPAPIRSLVHNAGVAPFTRRVTSEGHEEGLATNVLAPYVLTTSLRPKLLASTARVVAVAGAYHKKATLDLDNLAGRGPWQPMPEANRQKLMLVTWALEAARRFEGSGVTVNTLHPGIARTGIQRELPWPYQLAMRTILRPMFGSPRGPARNLVRLVLDPELATTSGAYFHERRRDDPAAQALDPVVGARVWSFLSEATGI